ncbi:MAG: pirin family protein [Bacteroidota bacterium]
MYTVYRAEERMNTSGNWGTSAETFFPSESEKYLGFGNLVQLTRTTLNADSGSSGMKLHRNMELVDIILSGTIGYQDSFGGASNFPENTLQVMSAGKGMFQAEFNPGSIESEKIQIGFLPNGLNKEPIKTKGLFDLTAEKNSLVELVSPNNSNSLTVRQLAAVLLGEFDENKHIGYNLNRDTVGLFVHVVSGVVTVNNQVLRRGDSVGIIQEEQALFHTAEPTVMLVIEVSMND